MVKYLEQVQFTDVPKNNYIEIENFYFIKKLTTTTCIYDIDKSDTNLPQQHSVFHKLAAL